MRKINWRPFRQVEVLHILNVLSTDIVSYDEKGRLYPCIFSMVSGLPVLIWAKVQLIGAWCGNSIIEFGITENNYVFGWPGKRLSSLPEHEYYWRNAIWISISDRDCIFKEFTKGML